MCERVPHCTALYSLKDYKRSGETARARPKREGALRSGQDGGAPCGQAQSLQRRRGVGVALPRLHVRCGNVGQHRPLDRVLGDLGRSTRSKLTDQRIPRGAGPRGPALLPLLLAPYLLQVVQHEVVRCREQVDRGVRGDDVATARVQVK